MLYFAVTRPTSIREKEKTPSGNEELGHDSFSPPTRSFGGQGIQTHMLSDIIQNILLIFQVPFGPWLLLYTFYSIESGFFIAAGRSICFLPTHLEVLFCSSQVCYCELSCTCIHASPPVRAEVNQYLNCPLCCIYHRQLCQGQLFFF